MTTTTPYGEWPSPITSTMLADVGRPLSWPAIVGDEVWWVEGRPAEGGRSTVMACGADGTIRELLPTPWNVRTRVHEYGGRPWQAIPVPDGQALVFTHYDDQRLYRLDPGGAEPVALTATPEAGQVRYADLVPAPNGVELLAVAERHPAEAAAVPGRSPERSIVAVPLDGRRADDPGAVRELVAGSTFLANPRISPDGRHLAWVAWDHPNMPWDGTELRVGVLGPNGTVDGVRTVLGGPTEAIFQPEWADARTLYAMSDRGGWWNPYRVRFDTESSVVAEPDVLHLAPEEFGAPLWVLGMATYAVLPDGRLLCQHGGAIGVLDPTTGDLTDIDLPSYSYFPAALSVTGDRAVLLAGGPTRPLSVVRLDPATGDSETIRSSVEPDRLPDAAYLPIPESTTVPGPDGRQVHVNIYPPTHPDAAAPDGDLPPYVVFVHGGPTGNSPPILDLSKAYFTSRGIGVVDVNYGGSTGYGREYRRRLLGQWGVVDVEDCVAAARALTDTGRADPARLAIRGGSAGGWTTLCALTRSEVFAAGASTCGVTDVIRLAEITHDFESRYLDGLIGAGPELAATGRARSPLTHAADTKAPVLLLQGEEDPIVPLEQAEQFATILAENGIEHRLVVYPGEQHGFRRAESQISAAEEELSFYGRVMGFNPHGVPTKPPE